MQSIPALQQGEPSLSASKRLMTTASPIPSFLRDLGLLWRFFEPLLLGLLLFPAPSLSFIDTSVSSPSTVGPNPIGPSGPDSPVDDGEDGAASGLVGLPPDGLLGTDTRGVMPGGGVDVGREGATPPPPDDVGATGDAGS